MLALFPDRGFFSVASGAFLGANVVREGFDSGNCALADTLGVIDGEVGLGNEFPVVA